MKVKIKRYISQDNYFKFPQFDMHFWLTENDLSNLGILEKIKQSPQFLKIECKSILNKFIYYGKVSSINPNIDVENGYIWIPSELIPKSIIIEKNTEVEITALSIEDYTIAESVSIKLNEKEVDNWSEEESVKAIRNYRLHNRIAFLDQHTYLKPGTKPTVIGFVESIFPHPESHTKLFVIDKDTKVFLKGLPKNQQKVIDFNQIGGLSNIIEKLREIIQLPITCPEYLSRFGIKSPKGMLMYGPPGNGKTMIARAVAQSMGSSFISIEGPELMSKYVGVGEQRLREKFEEAQTKGNCVIFIDEIDSIASIRSDTAAEYQVSIVATLLNLMDGMKSNSVFVIGATNRINAIDPALRRPGRFDLEFEVPLPNTTARFDILQKYIKLETNNLFEENVSMLTLKRLAELTNGYSGADLSLLYREAVMHAVRRNIKIDSATGKLIVTSSVEETKINADDFFEAMKRIIPTTMRNEECTTTHMLWEDLLGVDDAKQKLVELKNKLEYFVKSENIITRASFANFILCGPIGSGKHTLLYAFASKYGYETIDIDVMKLLSMDQKDAYEEIENKFNKAKQISPSIILLSNIPSDIQYQHYVNKIIHETNLINKRSTVFVVLVHDGTAESAGMYIGYKKFGFVIEISLPNEEFVNKMISKYNIPENNHMTFEGKPIGQLITLLSEYSLDKQQ